MARNGSGSYSVPNTFVAGTTITASGHNQNWDDVEAEVTNSVAADGQTSMTGALKASNGTAAAPSVTFASDTDTGLYRIGANNIGVAVGGANVLDIGAAGLTIPGNLSVTGSLTAPLSGINIIGATALTAPATDDTLPIYDLSATANRRILVSDFLKVIDSLTADATPDRAADYTLTYDASASAVKKVLLQNLPGKLPRGHIDGCILSNGTDATNDINIAAGVCRDSTNAVDITVAAMLGKQLDANWAPGAAAGMRNSAAGIANGTYHIYAVAKADGTQDIYAHTSTTVATVITALQAESGGTSYLYARRIGSILREGAALVLFTQTGDYFERATLAADVAAANPGTSAVTRTLSVPTGVTVTARVILALRNTGSTSPGSGYLSALASTDETPSETIGQVYGLTTKITEMAQVDVVTNTSAQIRSRIQVSGADVTVNIKTRGWIDPRGKDS